jgi:hypothetical protein
VAEVDPEAMSSVVEEIHDSVDDDGSADVKAPWIQGR